jgi:hypothetical protein
LRQRDVGLDVLIEPVVRGLQDLILADELTLVLELLFDTGILESPELFFESWKRRELLLDRREFTLDFDDSRA